MTSFPVQVPSQAKIHWWSWDSGVNICSQLVVFFVAGTSSCLVVSYVGITKLIMKKEGAGKGENEREREREIKRDREDRDRIRLKGNISMERKRDI